MDEHVDQRAITETTAFQMAEMLADVVNSGTAWPARREGFLLPAAARPARPTTITTRGSSASHRD
jgi:membrane peptidoglycan carboxypeptidase